MEFQSITCPNCGAKTTNHKNCDFCGSLLVQIADKPFVKEYIEYVKNYDDKGLISVVDKYFDILKKNKGLSLRMFILNDHVPIFQIDGVNDKGNVDGYIILLKNGVGEKWNTFLESNVRKIFELSNNGGFAAMHFGCDPKGTSQIIKQLIIDVFACSTDTITYCISGKSEMRNGIEYPINHYATYDQEGHLKNSLGCGENEFSDVSPLIKRGCLGIFALLITPILGIAGYGLKYLFT